MHRQRIKCMCVCVCLCTYACGSFNNNDSAIQYTAVEAAASAGTGALTPVTVIPVARRDFMVRYRAIRGNSIGWSPLNKLSMYYTRACYRLLTSILCGSIFFLLADDVIMISSLSWS